MDNRVNAVLKKMLIGSAFVSLNGVAYAEDVVPDVPEQQTVESVVEQTVVTTTPQMAPPETATSAAPPDQSMVVPANAAEALKAKEDEGSAEKNIEEVFNRDRNYSLSKKGSFSINFDTDYSYYRDSRIDIATELNKSDITRFRIEDDAQHTISNVVSFQYGLKDNLTIGASIPLILKADINAAKNVAGLGDIGFNLRWEPFELERDKLPLTISANLSTKTGDSPYEVPSNSTLSTGKGYYSFGGGISTRKFFDPVVLFASGQLGYGLKEKNLNYVRGGTNAGPMTSFQPGLNFGFSMGYAYALNYDVSISMSYSQGFSVGSVYEWQNGQRKSTGLSSSSTLGTSLGIRVSPKKIVNTSVSFGLSEDAPDVSLSVSLPIDFEGFKR